MKKNALSLHADPMFGVNAAIAQTCKRAIPPKTGYYFRGVDYSRGRSRNPVARLC